MSTERSIRELRHRLHSVEAATPHPLQARLRERLSAIATRNFVLFPAVIVAGVTLSLSKPIPFWGRKEKRLKKG